MLLDNPTISKIANLTTNGYMRTSAGVGTLASVPIAYFARDYGAVADDSTDDSGAIQDAIDAAEDGGGGLVYLNPGIYKTLSTLTVPAGVSLAGAGGKASYLHYAGDNLALHAYTDEADESRHFGRFSGFQLYSTTGTHGIRIEKATCITLEELMIHGFSTAGLHLYSADAGKVCLNILAKNCAILNNEVGVLASGYNDHINGISFLGCSIRTNKSYNIRVSTGINTWTFVDVVMENVAGPSTPAPYTEDPSAFFCQYGRSLAFVGCYYEAVDDTAAVKALQIGTYPNVSIPAGVFVYGVLIAGCSFLGFNTQTAIIIGNAGASQPTGAKGINIVGNHFYGFSVGINPINIDGGLIGRNTYDTVATNVSARGAGVTNTLVLDDPPVLATGGGADVDDVITTLQGLGLVKQS